jgi:hypothetical protein
MERRARIMTKWLEEGWQTFMEDVLAEKWPDHPALRLLCEVCFYAGANYAGAKFTMYGVRKDVYEELMAELAEHNDQLRARKEALDEAEKT